MFAYRNFKFENKVPKFYKLFSFSHLNYVKSIILIYSNKTGDLKYEYLKFKHKNYTHWIFIS